MSQLTLNRRACLRGALGSVAVSIGLPPLEAMFDRHGTAYADGKPIPRRFATWFWAQGVGKEWFPIRGNPQPWVQNGKQVGTVDATWTAPSELDPFVKAGLRQDISVITGARLFGWSETMHDAQDIGVLTGFVVQKCGGFCVATTGKSIVQEVSDRWRADGSRLPYLAAGITGGFSYTGLPHERSPGAMFDRVFGTGAVSSPFGPSGLSVATRTSVLDLVRDESTTLCKRLSATDCQRVQAYQQSIRDLETRLASQTSGTTAATANKLTRPTVAANDYDGIHDAFARLMAVALASGQTRVLSVTMDAGQSGAVYANLGLKAGYHGVTHMPADVAWPAIHAVTTWKMQKLAQFIGYLKAIPEGAGTVLDNSLVFAASEMDDATTHYCINTPMILAGRSGGGLKTGLYYAGFVGDHPYSTGSGGNQEPSTKVLLTILRALGEKDTQYGLRNDSATSAPITDPFSALLPG